MAVGHLLFITQTAHPWGGVETWLEYLANALAWRGWRVTVGLVRGRRFHDPASYRGVHPVPASVEIPALTGTTEGRVRAVMRAIAGLAPDVVVPVNIADALEAVRRLKAAGGRQRLLYPMHGLSSAYFRDVHAFRGMIDFAVGVNRLAARALSHVSGLEHRRVGYAPCGVPVPAVEPTLGGTAFRIVYVGRLTQAEKRVRDLVPLCRALEGAGIAFELDIAGDGEEAAYLRSALASPTIRLLGFRTRTDLYSTVYPDSAVALVLSSSETGPIAAWEGMRHGATVVTTSYLGLRAEGSIVHGVNGLVAPVGAPSALAEHVITLARDPGLLLRLRRSALDTAARHYGLDASVDAWEATLRACIELPVALDVSPVPPPKASARLDAVFGAAVAESLRAFLGRGLRHRDPGGEWPHTWHPGSREPDAIATAIAALDHA